MIIKTIKFLIFASLLLAQSCQSTRIDKEEKEAKSNRLAKAAVYNTQLGLGYLKQGNRPRAKSKLFAALKQAPDSPDVLSALAYYFEQTEQYDEAESYYTQALKVSHGQGAQYNNYGAYLCRKGDYKKSITYFEKAVSDQQYPNTAGAYENAGLCSLEIPDYEKSIYYFQKALEQDPERSASFYELMKIEKKLGQNQKAIELLNKYPYFKTDASVLAFLGINKNKNQNDKTHV